MGDTREISKLIAGFKGFRATYYERRPQLFQDLTREGQRPEILLIACSDARVEPAILFGAEPGELFVVRNVANLVPPYQPDGHYHGTSAAVEFAVRDLKVRDIVVLGHSHCGGIHALCESARGRTLDREFIAQWISIVGDATETLLSPSGENNHAVEQAAVLCSIDNLRTFPWIVQGEQSGELALHGWWFDMDHGALWALDHEARTFKPLDLSL